MDSRVAKSHLRCLKSHTMPSASKRPLPKAHSKDTQANKLNLSNSLQLPRQTNSQITILLTLSAMPTIPTTNSNITSSKVKVSKMAQPRNALSVGTTVLNLRGLLSILRVQLNKLHLAMRLLVVKEVVTAPLTQLPNSKEVARVRNPNSNLVIHNNLKVVIIPSDIPTIRAPITPRT